MRRCIILTLLIAGLLLPTAASAGGLELIVTLKSANKINQVKAKYDLQVLGQMGQEPVFLVLTDGTDEDPIEDLAGDKWVTDVEPNGLVSLESKPPSIPGGFLDLDQSTMSLFQSVMSLFGEGSPTDFFGTEVPEHYAEQIALDVIHASDTRDITTGAGTRIAFIDTGVDLDHPAIRTWLEPGVNLLGGGSASEYGSIDQSTMSLFEDLVRALKNSSIDMSTMSLFWDQLLRAGLDQSVMSLFWERLAAGALDQSTMSLFWEELQRLWINRPCPCSGSNCRYSGPVDHVWEPGGSTWTSRSCPCSGKRCSSSPWTSRPCPCSGNSSSSST